jgi:cysteinyl-tRNA synthetase, unknown class
MYKIILPLLFFLTFTVWFVTPTAAEAGRCIYNQAYQETHVPDSIETILNNAKNCYVLVDPYEIKSPTSTIAAIKRLGNEVSCYISVGTGEAWRSDFKAMRPFLVKKEWADWEGEFFIKNADPKLVSLMERRITELHRFGCQWVEFDNMDWTNDVAQVKQYGITMTRP